MIIENYRFSIQINEDNERCTVFSKRTGFCRQTSNNCLKKLLNVKKVMVREFEDYNISKILYAFNIIDELKLSGATNDLDHRLERTDSLRSGVFYLISFKHLVDTNNKQEDESKNFNSSTDKKRISVFVFF